MKLLHSCSIRGGADDEHRGRDCSYRGVDDRNSSRSGRERGKNRWDVVANRWTCRASRSCCAPGPSISQWTNAGVDKADYLAHTIVDRPKGRQNAFLYISHTIGCHLFCPYPLGQFGQKHGLSRRLRPAPEAGSRYRRSKGCRPDEHSRKVFVIKGLTLIRQCKQAHRPSPCLSQLPHAVDERSTIAAFIQSGYDHTERIR